MTQPTADALWQQICEIRQRREFRDAHQQDLMQQLEMDAPDPDAMDCRDLEADAQAIDLMTQWVAAELREVHDDGFESC